MNNTLNNVFELNGIFYVIERDQFEPEEFYLDRSWFIINKIKTCNNFNFDEIVVLSKAWANFKLYGCTYSENIMKFIK